MIWLFSGSALSKLALAAGGMALLSGPLNHSSTWIYGKTTNLHQIPARAQKIANPVITNVDHWRRIGQGAVIVDLERWPETPKQQQAHPVQAYRFLYQHLSRHHHQIIATPSFNLVRSMFPEYQGSLYQKFVQADIAGKIAPYVRTYVIQAQGAERNPIAYRKIVMAVSRQVHRMNPYAVVLSGLSTSPSNEPVPIHDLIQDVRETRYLVSGYAVNIPQKSRYCPSCGDASHAETAVKFLRAETHIVWCFF